MMAVKIIDDRGVEMLFVKNYNMKEEYKNKMDL